MRPVFFPSSNQPGREIYGWHWLLSVWLPVVLAIAVIVTESTDTFSAQHTSSWLRPILERCFGAFPDAGWDSFHHYLRKTGHFVGYGAVAITFLRAWLHTLRRQGKVTLFSWRFESSILAILCTGVVATCDEIHQTFIPSRTGIPLDVLLDTAGATVFCLLVWMICWTPPANEPSLQ